MRVQCLPAIFKAAWTLEENEREKAIEEVSEALQFLENELKAKFFGGDTIGLLDIAALYIAFWLPLLQEAVGLNMLNPQKLPKLHQWSQDFCSHSVVKENLPPAARVLGFMKARYASLTAGPK